MRELLTTTAARAISYLENLATRSVAPSMDAVTRLSEGIEGADSWATDAHQWLSVPYDNGVAFVRDFHALRAAMAITHPQGDRAR